MRDRQVGADTADCPVPAATAVPVRLGWHALSAASAGVTSLVAYLWIPQVFLADDKRNQYLPVAQDIGRRLAAGEWLPAIDPNLGPSGNYALDVQYGLYDPTHWVVDLALAQISNLALAAFLWSLAFEMVLAVGVSALCGRLRVPMPWCAVAGLAAATSGWVYFHLALDWIPGLVSFAWVPWLWWAWIGGGSAPRRRDCVAIAGFCWLVVTGGWPATWLLLLALAVGWVVESAAVRPQDGSRRDRLHSLLPRVLALLGGLVASSMTVLPLLRATPETVRQTAIENTNFLTSNLADMLAFAAPQLHADLLSFAGAHSLGQPIYFVAWFAVVVLWAHRWTRDTWRLPGMATCLVGLAVMVLLTQAPSSLGPIRDQIRELAGVQLFFVVGVAVVAGGSRPWVLSRRRVIGILLTFATMLWLSFGRHPDGFRGCIGIGIEVGIAGLLLLLGARTTAWAAVTALASTVLMTVVAFDLYHGNGTSPEQAFVARQTAGAFDVGRAEEPFFVATGRGTPADWVAWQRAGVGRAFADLGAGDRMSPGYSSISQDAYSEQFCLLAAQGDGCGSEISRLFAVDPITHRRWVDLLGYRTLFVEQGPRLDALRALHPAGWTQVAQADDLAEWRRTGPVDVAGQVTDVLGRAHVRALDVSNETQRYQVAAPRGALLVFRDLYWPGYSASWNGHSVPTTTLHGVLVTVRLPSGASGELTLVYRPLSRPQLVGFPLTGALLVAAAVLLAGLDPRRRTPPARSDGSAARSDGSAAGSDGSAGFDDEGVAGDDRRPPLG